MLMKQANMETVPMYVEAFPEREVVLHLEGVEIEEEVAFRRSRGFQMDINSKRQEEMVPSPPRPRTFQSDIVEPTDPIDLIDPLAPIDIPRDIAVIRKILACAR
jgi:hypothetical protein